MKKYKLNLTDFYVMNELTSELSLITSQRREEEYYFLLAKKLNNSQANAKTFWFILKTIYNGKKIPVMPPLLIDGMLVSDFKEKNQQIQWIFLVASVHHLIMVVNIQVSLFFILINERLYSVCFLWLGYHKN